MKTHLTQKFVDSVKLPERGQELILRDQGLTGFGLRVTSGATSYIVEARVNGKSKRVTVGRADLLTLEEARQKGIALLAQMTAGIDPQAEKQKLEASQITLGEVLDHYLTVQKLKPVTRNGVSTI